MNNPDTGKFVSVSGQVITYSSGGKNGITRTVQTDAKVTINGKDSGLPDLRSGDNLTFTGDPASIVVASR